MKTTAQYPSDVLAVPALGCWRKPIVGHQALLLGERNKDAPGCLGVDIANESGFQGSDCGSLLRAVAAILHRELICVDDRVDLPGEAKPHPHMEWLFERLRKHRNLLRTILSDRAAATRFRVCHPRQGNGDLLQDFHRLCETHEGIASGREWIVAFEGLATGTKRSVVDGAASLLRPFIEKFKGVLDRRDFLNHACSLLHENRTIEHPIVHQILQVERIVAFRVRRRPITVGSLKKYVFSDFGRQGVSA